MEAMVEYEWPVGSNEKWFIMEHVGDFLSIKSFNRKHRELNARTLSAEEKEELLSHQIISQIESTLSSHSSRKLCADNKLFFSADLQAVKSDDLLDLMAKNCVPNEKSLTNVNETLVDDSYELSRIQQNSIKPYVITQDGFIFDRKNYSIHQLQPTPTTFYAPVSMENPTQSLLDMKNEIVKALDSIKIPDNIPVADIDYSPLKNTPNLQHDMAFCGICGVENIGDERKSLTSNMKCSSCKRSCRFINVYGALYMWIVVHTKCLGISRRSIDSLKWYNWKCIECKICEKCQKPIGDVILLCEWEISLILPQMIFCDRCDRSYHSLCVGLEEIPLGSCTQLLELRETLNVGRWICPNCGFCSSCSKRRPGSCGWMTEVLKVGSSVKKIQVHCSNCSKLFNEGKFCLVCLEGFHGVFDLKNSTKNKPVITCSICRHLVHKECYDRPMRACLVCLGEVERDISLQDFLKNLKSYYEV